MNRSFTLADLSDALGGAVLAIRGNRNAEFSVAAAITGAGPGAVTFLRSTGFQAEALLHETKASVVLCRSDSIPADYSGPAALVAVADPRKAFIRVLARFFTPPRPSGIDPGAVLSPDARVHETAYVGPNAVIGRCEVGAGSVIYPNVVLYDGVKIGRNVTIHGGSVIGADGFGYERADDGAMEKFVHLGGVVIEDEVEIGSNTSIDRGSLGDTIIRRGAKIDNQVHIAHNADIGRDAVIIAMSMIGGSVRIGDRAWIAPSVTIINGITIGADSVCGLGAVVVKSVGDGVTVMGNPAREISEAKALLAAQKRLLED